MLELFSTLADIRSKIAARGYPNREQVRTGIVLRLLQVLEWNIWDSQEVCLDFVSESKSSAAQADILVLLHGSPAVTIRVGSMGATEDALSRLRLEAFESTRQIVTPFSVVTDGLKWEFYVSSFDSPFSQSRYQIFDLAEDRVESIQRALWNCLSKPSLARTDAAGRARKLSAEGQLDASIKNLIQEASQGVEGAPSSVAPERFMSVAGKHGHLITQEEAVRRIAEYDEGAARKASGAAEGAAGRRGAPSSSDAAAAQTARTVRQIPPNDRMNLIHTSLRSGQIGEEHARRWSSLLHGAIREAAKRKVSFQTLQRMITAEISRSELVSENFRQVEGTSIFVEDLDPTNCYLNVFAIARELKLEMKLEFRWLNREGAEYPGEDGAIHWRP